MHVDELREFARRSSSGLSQQDDAVLRAWIDEAFGTDDVAVVVASIGAGISELLLSMTSYGVELVFSARLQSRSSGRSMGWLVRRVALDAKIAVHVASRIDPAYRGRGIGTRLLEAAVRTYDALGIIDVTLRAGLEFGRWHWARLGFEFARELDQAAIVEHAQRVVAKLELDVTVDDASGALQIAELTCARPVTPREIAVASGSFNARQMLDLARAGIDLDAPVPLGQAILLCGPEWSGLLRLRGPSRAVFDLYVRRRRDTVD